MKTTLISCISITLLTASTWQNIDASIPTLTDLDVQLSSLEQSVIEFNIDGFHLIPVQTSEGKMYLARLEDGASLLEAGSPDMHKYARSILIPDDKQMAIKVLSSEFIDYENILIAPSKGNLSRLIYPSDVEYESTVGLRHHQSALQLPVTMEILIIITAIGILHQVQDGQASRSS